MYTVHGERIPDRGVPFGLCVIDYDPRDPSHLTAHYHQPRRGCRAVTERFDAPYNPAFLAAVRAVASDGQARQWEASGSVWYLSAGEPTE